ncbi:hypothetical protein Tco_1229818 [Tanacetum coccineum]
MWLTVGSRPKDVSKIPEFFEWIFKVGDIMLGEANDGEVFLAASGPGMSIVRCAVDELIVFSKESEVLKYMKFFFEQNIAEERHSVNAIRDQADTSRACLAHVNVMIVEMQAMNNHQEVYDSLESLKELKEVENDKLIALNNMIFETEEKIRLMEGHVQVMEEAIMSG